MMSVIKHKTMTNHMVSIGLLLLLPAFRLALCQEPEFPSPFPWAGQEVASISCRVSTLGRQLLRQETLDRKNGRQTIIIQSNNGQMRGKTVSTYVDLKRGFISYEAYNCIQLSPDYLESAYRRMQIWYDGDQYQGKPLYYGYLALWYNAKYGRYKMKMNEDNSNKNYVSWILDGKDTGDQRTYEFRVIRDSLLKRDILDSIVIWPIPKGEQPEEVIDITNIGDETQKTENLLQVPTGYGCQIDEQMLREDQLEIRPDLSANFTALQMEVSATNEDLDAKPRIEFLSLEIIYSRSHGLKLIRRKDSKLDQRIITDFRHRVNYLLDQEQGRCKIEHHGSVSDEQQNLATRIVFSNGLELTMSLQMIGLLFTQIEGFHLIKSVGQSDSIENNVYYERTVKSENGRKLAYITRRYLQIAGNPLLRLASVNYRLLSQDLNHIVASYQFNLEHIINPQERFDEETNLQPGDPEAGSQLLKLASIFDLSDSCHLESNRSRSGHDYVWLQLSFSSSFRELENLRGELAQFRASLYSQLLANLQPEGMSLLRMPMLEVDVNPSQDKLTARILLLDQPPLRAIFATQAYRDLPPGEAAGSHLLQDLARDLNHCASLCRFYRCKTFSYNPTNHLCRTSSKNIHQLKLVDSPSASVLYYPEAACCNVALNFDEYSAGSLTNIVRQITNRNYEYERDGKLPARPDILRNPPGPEVDMIAYQIEVEKYWLHLAGSLFSDWDRKLLFRYKAKGAQMQNYYHFLIPNQVSIEQDSLSRNGLNEMDSIHDLSDQRPIFHQGFSQRNFRLEELDKLKFNVKSYDEISLDRCELACIDNMCSSYSYCHKTAWRKSLCITTGIYEFGSRESQLETIMTRDDDCFIAQRDFLSKYNRFDNLPEPEEYIISRLEDMSNPSECAHKCYINSQQCLAFDYCQPKDLPDQPGQQQQAICYLRATRDIYSGQDLPEPKTAFNHVNKDNMNCNHYSRSYLADFWTLLATEIKTQELDKIQTNRIDRLTVDSCAEECALKDDRCSGFQFCINMATSSDSIQTCWLIDEGPREELEVSIDQGKANARGEFLVPSGDGSCHLFVMRSDASEADSRELAFFHNSKSNGNSDQATSKHDMSILAALLMFIGTTILFTFLAVGFILLTHNNMTFGYLVNRVSNSIRRR